MKSLLFLAMLAIAPASPDCLDPTIVNGSRLANAADQMPQLIKDHARITTIDAWGTITEKNGSQTCAVIVDLSNGYIATIDYWVRQDQYGQPTEVIEKLRDMEKVGGQ